MTIANREEIIEQLTEMLMKFDKDMNSYDTDIYLYYDEENKTGKIDTFVNVGGNSWLNDDHYTIYTDKQHNENMYDWWEDYTEFAIALGIDIEVFRKEIAKYYEEADDYKPDFWETREYIKKNDNYVEKLTEEYNNMIDDMESDYKERAEEILSRFEEEQEYIEAREKERENW